MQQNDHITQPAEDEIDLVEIIRFVWESRKTILIIAGIFILIRLFVVLFSTPQYKAEARILPELRQQRGGASDLLRQFGISGAMLGADGYEALRPDLYPQVLSSTPFFYTLLQREIITSDLDEPIMVKTYLEEHMQGNAVLGAARKYTIGLPWTVLGWIRSLAGDEEEAASLAAIHQQIPRLSKQEHETINKLRSRINSDMDMQAWVISVSAEFPDPLAAAHIAELAVNYLSDYVIEYQTEKAHKNLVFIEERYEEKKAEFYEAQQRLARHLDAARQVVSLAARTEEQRLQHQYTMAFNLYNELAQQLENARIRVQQETPVIKLLEPVQVPLERSQPKRARMMMIAVFLGGILGVGFVFARREFFKLKGKLSGK